MEVGLLSSEDSLRDVVDCGSLEEGEDEKEEKEGVCEGGSGDGMVKPVVSFHWRHPSWRRVSDWKTLDERTLGPSLQENTFRSRITSRTKETKLRSA